MPMTPGEGAKALKALRKFSPLRTDMEFSEDEHHENAIGVCLADLWLCDHIHPLTVAANALEDQNHHDLCAVVRTLVDVPVKQTLDRETFVLKAALSYALANIGDLNEALSLDEDENSIEVDGDSGPKVTDADLESLMVDIEIMHRQPID